MDALTHALSPAPSPLRPQAADTDLPTEQDQAAEGFDGASFEDAVKEQETANSSDTIKPVAAAQTEDPSDRAMLSPETDVIPRDLPSDGDVQDIAETKPDIIPIADVNGSEDVTIRPADPEALARNGATPETVDPVTATELPVVIVTATQTDDVPAPDRNRPDMNRDDADVWFARGRTERASSNTTPVASSNGVTGVDPETPQTTGLTSTTVATPDGDIRPDASRSAPQTPQGLATPPTQVTVTETATAQPQTLTPVTLGTPPIDNGDVSDADIKPVKTVPVPIADVDGDIEARTTSKSVGTFTEPARPAVETLRASDLPMINTLSGLSGDTLATPKTLPLTPQATAITPFSGLVERMAANYVQTLPGTTPVTLDKLPQTVVALTMNAQSATLQIDPPELGRIQLEYQFDTQGRTVVTLIPESEAARAALVDRMAAITAALSQSTSGEVDIRMGDAADFTAFDSDGEAGEGATDQGGNAASESGSQGSGISLSSTPVQYFTGGSSGQTDRLHILV